MSKKEKQILHFYIPKDLVEKIDKYTNEQCLPTRTSGIISIITTFLKEKGYME